MSYFPFPVRFRGVVIGYWWEGRYIKRFGAKPYEPIDGRASERLPK